MRALQLWRAHDPARRLLHETGVLWMFGDDDSFGHESARVLRENGARLDLLTSSEASRRYPQIDFDGIRSVFFEPDAGYLCARRALRGRRAASGGGRCRIPPGRCRQPGLRETGRRSPRLPLEDGTLLEADVFVFACGPWLASLFPDVVGGNITATRQDVFYFGAPAGDARFTEPALPVWMDFAAGSRSGQIYGIPAAGSSGFKIADDAPGPVIDPTSGDAARERGWDCPGPRISVPAVPCTRRRASCRLGSLSVREHAGRPFHRRPPPGRVERLDCWRRLRPWL